MEELIKNFLDGYGYGDGSGSSYGSGDGDGDGYGDGDGDGDGSSYGYGYGYGDGSGSSYGSGDGDGDGSSYGYGYGYGYGDGLSLKIYLGSPVYYVDGIPCVFESIKNDFVAKVRVIDVMDFSTSEQFIYKFNYCFAHGETIKKAKEDAERKYYSQLDVAAKITEFHNTFKSDVKYPAKAFYDWHTILTGSCDSGKDMFVRQHNIDINSEMTVKEFYSIVKNAYGWNIISQLEETK